MNESLPILITLATLAGAVMLFISNRLPSDLVALMVVFTLGISGVLTQQEAFSGFSRSAVITIVAICILAEGLEITGITDQISRFILQFAGDSETRLTLFVMLIAGFFSLMMNNIAAASILLPSVTLAASRARIPHSRLLMPLSFATLLGGMATLFTTTNIIVSSLLRSHELPGFGILDFLPIGLPLALLGVAYMLLVGRHLLPSGSPLSELGVAHSRQDLIELYGVGNHLFRARVPADSVLHGDSLSHSKLRETYGVNVIGVERRGRVDYFPTPQKTLRSDDILYLQGSLTEFRSRDVEPYLEILPDKVWKQSEFSTEDYMILEAVVTRSSPLIDKTIAEVNLRETYNATALAVLRGGDQLVGNLAKTRLQFGDALLIYGAVNQLKPLRHSLGLLILGEERDRRPVVASKKGLASSIMLISMIAAMFLPDASGEVMLGGAIAMVLAGILSMEEAYQSIEWKTVVIVGGMLPLGVAMTKTGTAAMLEEILFGALGGASPTLVLAAFVLLTITLSQFVHGAAVASVLAPIAIKTASDFNFDPRSIAMAVALATSMTFLTPLGHPVNLLVMGPGEYHFRDYFRVGGPLTLLLFIVLMVLLPVIFPLQ
jgi:di/tricarboxylate transporter